MKEIAVARVRIGSLVLLLSTLIAPATGLSQTTLALTDLSAFQSPGNSWRIAGDVRADLNQNNILMPANGTGVLVNVTDKKNKGQDIVTVLQHSDADVELDYMMAKGSNSGVYLQGRYEVQLLDSWGTKRPIHGDNGGIYERWDEARGKGNEGYDGYPPRQNVSSAPGLWQHLKISFQAPRFDAAGKKIENARMIRVELNGVTIHENVELAGPTRGSLGEEVASGPLRIQGDHGSVAFRNIKIVNYDKPRPELVNLRYTIYKGKFEQEPDYNKLPPEAEGTSVILTSSVNNRIDNEYLIKYSGTLKVKEPGEYNFNLRAPGGGGILKINNQTVIPRQDYGVAKVTLPAGDLPFQLLYSKFVSWTKPALGLVVAGPGIREYLISDVTTSTNEVVDPILLEAPGNTILRSFMDLPGGPRLVHAVNVGSPDQVHYTYDLDYGSLVQIWRGGFLDATPMWHSRGDGSSRPYGAVKHLGKPRFVVGRLSSPQDPWQQDSVGTGFRPKGYTLDEADRPTFRYQIYGSSVSDATRVIDGGQGIQREITVQNPGPNMYVRLAEANKIETVSNGVYLVDDKSYYLRVNDAGGATPIIRNVSGKQELILPIQNKISYSILF
ncbi:MAG TPA: family 16 glycoside hydrolase [Chitinophagaceae bacterium]|nr:family 16 glycoside hydrolase [Chitinophagaceae bacterium]